MSITCISYIFINFSVIFLPKTKFLRLFSSQFLASLQLDQTNLTPGQETLPEILLEKCAEFSVKPDAIRDLVSAMQGTTLGKASEKLFLLLRPSNRIRRRTLKR